MRTRSAGASGGAGRYKILFEHERLDAALGKVECETRPLHASADDDRVRRV